MTVKSTILAAVLVAAAVGGRAVSSGAALRVSQQRRDQTSRSVSQRPRAATMPRAVTFREVRGRGLLVDVWINSSGPFTFAVDTGAGITIVSPRVAGAARVAIQGGASPSISGMSGAAVTGQAGRAQTIAVGDPENNLPGRTDLIISSGLPRDIDGLLDPNDAFGALGYSLDIPRHELSFFDPRESPLTTRVQPPEGAVVTWQQQGHSHRPFVTLNTGEQALIDTGSSLGLGVHDRNSEPIYSRSSAVHDVGGTVASRRGEPRTVSIGSLELRNVPTDIISGAASDAPMVLGLNALRPFRLRFDPLHRLIEISPSS